MTIKKSSTEIMQPDVAGFSVSKIRYSGDSLDKFEVRNLKTGSFKIFNDYDDCFPFLHKEAAKNDY